MHDMRLAVLALIATTLVASGCGGTSQSSNGTVASTQNRASGTSKSTIATQSPAPTPVLTRAQLIARADLICHRVNAKRALLRISGEQDVARQLPPLAVYEQEAVVELRKLTPPPSMTAGWQRIVQGSESFAEATASLGESAKAKKLPQAETLSIVAERTLKRTFALAKQEGFNDCAQN